MEPTNSVAPIKLEHWFLFVFLILLGLSMWAWYQWYRGLYKSIPVHQLIEENEGVEMGSISRRMLQDVALNFEKEVIVEQPRRNVDPFNEVIVEQPKPIISPFYENSISDYEDYVPPVMTKNVSIQTDFDCDFDQWIGTPVTIAKSVVPSVCQKKNKWYQSNKYTG